MVDDEELAVLLRAVTWNQLGAEAVRLFCGSLVIEDRSVVGLLVDGERLGFLSAVDMQNYPGSPENALAAVERAVGEALKEGF